MKEKVVLLAVAALVPALALPVYGPRALAMGGAYVAVADDESSIYYNPGGMAAAGDYFACVPSFTITADDRILFGETETTLENLVPLVEARLKETGPEAPVYIAGDRQAGLGIAVEILDHLRNAGIEKVSFSCNRQTEQNN